MNEHAKLLIDQVVASFQRIRALLFTMTVLCAFIFANTYIERYSIDEKQVLYSSALKAQLTHELEKEADTIKRSVLEARIQRIDNALKDFKLRTVTLPAIGLAAPANDVNVIVGIFMAALAVWLIFSANQISEAIFEKELENDIRAAIPALRHAAIFVYKPPQQLFKSLLANIMFILPPLTLASTTYEDFVSIVNYDKQQHLANMFPDILARVIALVAITVILTYAAASLIKIRKTLTEFFYHT